ncbi:MAG: NUDIX domain-containing protein [Chloroflexi bacterium]|nr:NUDIX domain-containing protein [Chloroflexota bacterium]
MTLRPDLVACWMFRVAPNGLEILLIRRAVGRPYAGLWQCVTGRLEADERIIAAVLREVEEETGLRPADLEVVFETDLVNLFHEAAVDAVMCEAVFAARVRADAEVRLSDEHDDQRWLAPDAATALVMWPAYERAIATVQWLVDGPARADAFALGTGPEVAAR